MPATKERVWLGSWLAGALFEATGGYGIAYTIACAILMGAAMLSLHRRRPPPDALGRARRTRLIQAASAPLTRSAVLDYHRCTNAPRKDVLCER